MTTMFDTLAAARDLEHAGMEPRQAEAVAGTMREAIAEGRLPAKADPTAAVAGLETRLTVRLHGLGIVVAGTGLTVALLELP